MMSNFKPAQARHGLFSQTRTQMALQASNEKEHDFPIHFFKIALKVQPMNKGSQES